MAPALSGVVAPAAGAECSASNSCFPAAGAADAAMLLCRYAGASTAEGWLRARARTWRPAGAATGAGSRSAPGRVGGAWSSSAVSAGWHAPNVVASPHRPRRRAAARHQGPSTQTPGPGAAVPSLEPRAITPAGRVTNRKSRSETCRLLRGEHRGGRRHRQAQWRATSVCGECRALGARHVRSPRHRAHFLARALRDGHRLGRLRC